MSIVQCKECGSSLLDEKTHSCLTCGRKYTEKEWDDLHQEAKQKEKQQEQEFDNLFNAKFSKNLDKETTGKIDEINQKVEVLASKIDENSTKVTDTLTRKIDDSSIDVKSTVVYEINNAKLEIIQTIEDKAKDILVLQENINGLRDKISDFDYDKFIESNAIEDNSNNYEKYSQQLDELIRQVLVKQNKIDKSIENIQNSDNDTKLTIKEISNIIKNNEANNFTDSQIKTITQALDNYKDKIDYSNIDYSNIDYSKIKINAENLIKAGAFLECCARVYSDAEQTLKKAGLGITFNGNDKLITNETKDSLRDFWPKCLRIDPTKIDYTKIYDKRKIIIDGESKTLNKIKKPQGWLYLYFKKLDSTNPIENIIPKTKEASTYWNILNIVRHDSKEEAYDAIGIKTDEEMANKVRSIVDFYTQYGLYTRDVGVC